MVSRQIIKEKTFALCPECLSKIPAQVYIENGHIIMEKNCPQHGTFAPIIEKDPELYQTLCHKTRNKSEIVRIGVKSLIVPVEYRCNLNCLFCFLPNRKKENISLEELDRTISNFEGSGIDLSGGEPTLREDLDDIIRMVKSAGKKCCLVTNGLRLVDPDYVASLKEAGLDQVFLSLYSLDEKMEEKICGGKNVLENKLKALKVMKEMDITVFLSLTVVPGLNEDEIKNIFNLALKHEVKFITIRAVARVGTYPIKEKFYFSDFLNSICQSLGVKRNELIAAREGRYTPYFIYVNAVVGKGGNKIYFHDKSFFSKVRILTKFCGEIGFLRLFPLLRQGRRLFQHIRVRIACWPDKYDFDLTEVPYGKYEHLYRGKERVDLFEAMILNEGL